MDPRPRAAALDAIIAAMRGPHGLSADVARLGHPPVSSTPCTATLQIAKEGRPIGCSLHGRHRPSQLAAAKRFIIVPCRTVVLSALDDRHRIIKKSAAD